jgi:hypothetical protein
MILFPWLASGETGGMSLPLRRPGDRSTWPFHFTAYVAIPNRARHNRYD